MVNGCGWEITLNLLLAGKRKRRIAGFTLIEILVAMAVFAIASLGLAMGVTSVIQSNQRSYLASIATNLAQDKLEELKATPASVGPCIVSNCDDPKPQTNGVEFTRTWEVFPSDPTPGVKRIDVTVEWTDHMPHNVTISSVMQE